MSVEASQTTGGASQRVPDEARLYESFRQYWHPVSYSGDLRDAPKAVTLLGERLVIVRLGGGVRAFRDLCPHRGTPLSLGSVENDHLRCAYHGWTYDCSGVCTAVPAVPDSPIVGRARVEAFLAAEQAGLIWVSLTAQPTMEVPVFPQAADPTFRVVHLPPYEWDCSATRRTENVIDLAHFAWLHDGLLGVRAHPEVPAMDVTREGGELRMDVEAIEPPGTARTTHVARRGDAVKGRRRYRIFLPFTVLNEHDYPDGNRHAGFWSFSPVGPKRTRCFMTFARNYALSDEEDQAALAFAAQVNEQDRPIVEGQRPEELPADLSIELHVKGPDRVSIEYRRWLAELADTPSALPRTEARPGGTTPPGRGR